MTISASIAAYEKRQAKGSRSAKSCYKCRRPLQETLTGNRRTDRGAVCSDCYYEELGRAIEEHPVASARAPRG